MGSWWGGEGGAACNCAHIPCSSIYIQICQLGVGALTLTHPETGPAKFVSIQHQIGTAPVCCTAKFYRRPGKYTPAPCPGSYKPARRLGPRPGASPFISPSTLPARVSVAWFTRNHREGNRYTVSPKQVRLGNMLGKGCGVGRIAASVVRWAWAVPLGIKLDLRRGASCGRGWPCTTG
jgi:hypothetical protein